MVINFPHESDVISYFPRFERDAAGKARLMFGRYSTVDGGSPTSYIQFVVADADGPTRFALMRPYAEKDPGCLLLPDDLNEGQFAFGIQGDGTEPDTFNSKIHGVLVGEVGPLMPRVGPMKTELGWSYSLGKERVVRSPGGWLFMYPPDFSAEQLFWDYSKDPDLLGGVGGERPPQIIGRDIIFVVGYPGMMGIMSYDDTAGVRPLVRWYGDQTRAAANVGTDGKDLVWTVGEDRPPGEWVYPTRSIMAAPYTTDPVALMPRRLRSDPSATVGLNSFAVGCGYAGHEVPVAGQIIVRLADGVSWTLPEAPDWKWGHVIGFTCEEVFLTYAVKTSAHIARVRLDSLGPGTAPD
jgi:hypothetical protein